DQLPASQSTNKEKQVTVNLDNVDELPEYKEVHVSESYNNVDEYKDVYGSESYTQVTVNLDNVDKLPEYKEVHVSESYTQVTVNLDNMDELSENEEGYVNESYTKDNEDEVDNIVNNYARQNGFVATKCHKDLNLVDKNIVRQHVYKCWKGGKTKSKKVEDIISHHDTASTKTTCSWQVAFYNGKCTTSIHLTKIENTYNHPCDPVNIKLAPKNLRFPQSILDKIKHYIVNGVRIYDESDSASMLSYLIEQCNNDSDYIVKPWLEGPSNELTRLFWMTDQQRNELWPKFYDVVIHDNTAKTNRYEIALSLFIRIDNNYKSRILAQALIKYEPLADYTMLAAVQLVYPKTRHLTCIYHIGENIKKKAKSKLHGDSIKSFIEDFYRMHNSHSLAQFELKYNEMLTKYKQYRDYLEKKLYPSRDLWARYSIRKIFTAGVESTQRVESLNGVLKKHLDRGTLLKELVK
ncbi:7319_t:CDS:2, partial [Racocetra fulgida]